MHALAYVLGWENIGCGKTYVLEHTSAYGKTYVLGWSLFQNFGKLYGNRVKFVRFR